MDINEKVSRHEFKERFMRSFEKNSISLITGQRQIGKTTFIKNFLLEEIKQPTPNEYLYINFDSLVVRENISSNGLKKTIENYYDAEIKNFKNSFSERKIVVIDEAQKLPLIFEEIKIIFDENKDDNIIKFILSGSSALDLYANSAESLAGRIDIIKAFSFNFFEIRDLLNISFTKTSFMDLLNPDLSFEELTERINQKRLATENEEIEQMLENSLLYGTLPDMTKLFKKNNFKNEAIDFIESYKNTYIEKDIRSLNRIGELGNFSRLFDLISAQTGNILVKSNLARDLGISQEAFNNYLSILENTFIIDLVQPYVSNLKKQLIKSPKVYVFDNSLISYVNGFQTIEQLKLSGNIGSFFENLIYQELKKRLIFNHPYLKICFYRTAHNTEIDFILDFRKKIIPIEVKWSKDHRNIKTRTLKQFIKEDAKADYGFVIYNGKLEINHEDRIIYFPAAYFATN